MRININELIAEVKIIEDQKLKAIVSLDFGDFKIKGFRIMVSDHENHRGEKLWVVPPSYKGGGGSYHPIFFTPDKDLWLKIQDKILDEFEKKQKEYWAKRMNLDKDDIKNIEFLK